MHERESVHFVDGPLHGMDKTVELETVLRVPIMEDLPVMVSAAARAIPSSVNLRTGYYHLERWYRPHDRRPRYLYLYAGEQS